MIKALQAWLTRLNRANELLVTATTGTAAINIHGRTVHNATGIAIEMDDVTRTSRVTDKIESMRRSYPHDHSRCEYALLSHDSQPQCSIDENRESSRIHVWRRQSRLLWRFSTVSGGITLAPIYG